LESGYLAQAFITDKRRGVVRLVNPYVLVTDERISTIEQILPVLEIAARNSSTPVLIVAEEIESNSQALGAMIYNALKGGIKAVGINAPKYGEEKRGILKDLALTTGATFITRENGLTLLDVKIEHLGKANKVEISKKETVIVGGKGNSEEIEERIELLKNELKDEEEIHVCAAIQNRITKLSSGAAIIKVGGMTEIEAIEKLHRVQDALEAVKSSLEEGILPGGGIALLKAGLKINKISEGAKVILKAIEEPFKIIALNADVNAETYLTELTQRTLGNKKTQNSGYNFITKEFVEDMFKEGIIDPTKVTKNALLNAFSAASTLITTNYAIVEKE
jgi:chaperonin GroEL